MYLYWAVQSIVFYCLFFFFSGSDSLTLVNKNEEVKGGNKEAGRKDSNMVAGTGGHLINLYCDNRAKVKKVKDLLMITNLSGKQKVCSRMSRHSQHKSVDINTMSVCCLCTGPFTHKCLQNERTTELQIPSSLWHFALKTIFILVLTFPHFQSAHQFPRRLASRT